MSANFNTTHKMTTRCQSHVKIAQLNWKENINEESSLPPINWEILKETAIHLKQRLAKHEDEISCQLSAEYNMGGVHIVRRLDFDDGTSWLARLRLHKTTANQGLCECLEQEVHTINVIRDRSEVPVPAVFGHDARWDNPVGVPFMLQEYIAADTAMDSFGGYPVHGGDTPPQFKEGFYDSLANIQVRGITLTARSGW